MRAVWVGLAVAPMAFGCQNSCQVVCMQMANYARQDCGISIPEAEVEDCVANQRSPSAQERDTCKDFGDIITIRSQWSCDDLATYFDEATGGDGTSR